MTDRASQLLEQLLTANFAPETIRQCSDTLTEDPLSSIILLRKAMETEVQPEAWQKLPSPFVHTFLDAMLKSLNAIKKPRFVNKGDNTDDDKSKLLQLCHTIATQLSGKSRFANIVLGCFHERGYLRPYSLDNYLEHFQKAKACYQKAADPKRSIAPEGMGRATAYLGNCWYKLGDMEKAARCWEKAKSTQAPYQDLVLQAYYAYALAMGIPSHLWQEAYQALKPYLEQQSFHRQIPNLEKRYIEKNFKKAEEIFNTLKSETATNPEVAVLYGLFLEIKLNRSLAYSKKNEFTLEQLEHFHEIYGLYHQSFTLFTLPQASTAAALLLTRHSKITRRAQIEPVVTKTILEHAKNNYEPQAMMALVYQIHGGQMTNSFNETPCDLLKISLDLNEGSAWLLQGDLARECTEVHQHGPSKIDYFLEHSDNDNPETWKQRAWDHYIRALQRHNLNACVELAVLLCEDSEMSGDNNSSITIGIVKKLLELGADYDNQAANLRLGQLLFNSDQIDVHTLQRLYRAKVGTDPRLANEAEMLIKHLLLTYSGFGSSEFDFTTDTRCYKRLRWSIELADLGQSSYQSPASTKQRWLHQGEEIIYMDETATTANGNCGFIAMDLKRETVVEDLKKHANNELYRKYLANEIYNNFMFDASEAQGNVTIDLFHSNPDVISQLNEFQQRFDEGEDIQEAFIQYCSNETVYHLFIDNYYAKNGWLTCILDIEEDKRKHPPSVLEIIANMYGYEVNIYRETSGNEIKLIYKTFELDNPPTQVFHLLHVKLGTGQGVHFNRLRPSDHPPPQKAPTATGISTFQPATSGAEEDEELKLAIELSLKNT